MRSHDLGIEINSKYKKIIKVIWLISTVLFIISFINIKIFIFRLNSNLVSYILFLFSLILPMMLFDYDRDWLGMKIVYNISLIAIIPISFFCYLFFASECEYFEFLSPEKTHILVVEEKAFLFDGRSNFYEKKFGIFIKKLNCEITTDDGFRPFSNEAYEIEWIDENIVNVRYDFGNEGVWKNEIIKFE